MISFLVKAQQPAATIPDFNFFKLNGVSFTNRDLEQDRQLFFVFFDPGCDHCQHAMKDINQHYKEFNKTAVYLISVDIKERINSFLNTYGKDLQNKKNVTVLQDLKNEFILKFKPRKYPSMFLYSKEKKLILYDDNEKNLAAFLQKIKA
jgi:thioredoxin-related protein